MLDESYLTYEERVEFDAFLANGHVTYAKRRYEEGSRIMPFGMYKGQDISVLPIYYLRFLLYNHIVEGSLRRMLQKILDEKVGEELKAKAEAKRKYYEREQQRKDCAWAIAILKKSYGSRWVYL